MPRGGGGGSWVWVCRRRPRASRPQRRQCARARAWTEASGVGKFFHPAKLCCFQEAMAAVKWIAQAPSLARMSSPAGAAFAAYPSRASEWVYDHPGKLCQTRTHKRLPCLNTNCPDKLKFTRSDGGAVSTGGIPHSTGASCAAEQHWEPSVAAHMPHQCRLPQ